jgi:hypothetical protein
MSTFIRFGDRIINMDNIADVTRRGEMVEVRMMDQRGGERAFESTIYRFSGKTAERLWEIFCDCAGVDEGESREGPELPLDDFENNPGAA